MDTEDYRKMTYFQTAIVYTRGAVIKRNKYQKGKGKIRYEFTFTFYRE
jgi:hypothetical protein